MNDDFFKNEDVGIYTKCFVDIMRRHEDFPTIRIDSSGKEKKKNKKRRRKD